MIIYLRNSRGNRLWSAREKKRIPKSKHPANRSSKDWMIGWRVEWNIQAGLTLSSFSLNSLDTLDCSLESTFLLTIMIPFSGTGKLRRQMLDISSYYRVLLSSWRWFLLSFLPAKLSLTSHSKHQWLFFLDSSLSQPSVFPTRLGQKMASSTNGIPPGPPPARIHPHRREGDSLQVPT